MSRALNPKSIHAPLARYSHGMEVPAGARLVVCSGQLAIPGNDIVPTDITKQAELCFANIEAILAEAGMTLADIVRLNAYVTDRDEMLSYMQVRDRLFGDPPPASTLVMVLGFSRRECRIEIEAIAAKVD